MEYQQIIVSPNDQCIKQYIGPIKARMYNDEFIFPHLYPSGYVGMKFTHAEFQLLETWGYTQDNYEYNYLKHIKSISDIQKLLSGLVVINNGKIKNIIDQTLTFNNTFFWYCGLTQLKPGQEQPIVLNKPYIMF